MKSRETKPIKKPYHTPRLLVYGDLRALTQAIGLKGMPDGGPLMLMTKS